jgi:hypothetical protein
MVPEEAARQSRKLATQIAEVLGRVAQSLVLKGALPQRDDRIMGWMI